MALLDQPVAQAIGDSAGASSGSVAAAGETRHHPSGGVRGRDRHRALARGDHFISDWATLLGSISQAQRRAEKRFRRIAMSLGDDWCTDANC